MAYDESTSPNEDKAKESAKAWMTGLIDALSVEFKLTREQIRSILRQVLWEL
jgi:hypothetical protein